MRGYSRLAQLTGDAFTYLRCTISKFAIEKLEVGWRRTSRKAAGASRYISPDMIRIFAYKIYAVDLGF